MHTLNTATSTIMSPIPLFEKMAQHAFMNKASEVHFSLDSQNETSEMYFRIKEKLVNVTEFGQVASGTFQRIFYQLFTNYSMGAKDLHFDVNAMQKWWIQMLIENTRVNFKFASCPTVKGQKVVACVYKLDANGVESLLNDD